MVLCSFLWAAVRFSISCLRRRCSRTKKTGLFRPHLSIVSAPVRQFGREAVKTLLSIVYSKKDALTELKLQPGLVIR